MFLSRGLIALVQFHFSVLVITKNFLPLNENTNNLVELVKTEFLFKISIRISYFFDSDFSIC